MNASDMSKMSETELQKELIELLKEQFNLRMQKKIGQLAQFHKLRLVRRQVARIKTILNQRTSK